MCLVLLFVYTHIYMYRLVADEFHTKVIAAWLPDMCILKLSLSLTL